MDRQTLDGRFELEKLVGKGGMGAVFRARDLLTGDTVAVKLLHGAETRHLRRFEREGQALATVAHPGIVRYVAHGTAQGQSYLAMEWLEGETLEARLGTSALSVIEALEMGMRVASALAEAHRKGVVHRDLKPANLLLVGGKAADAKVLDFGIARLGWDPSRLTRTGAPIGSALYMSPEQARASPNLDERTDIFSLGAVLHEALTMQPPFEGDDVVAILANILVADPEPLRVARPEAPAALEALIAAMLAKSPDQRPASAGLVATELASIRELLRTDTGPSTPAGPRPRKPPRSTAELMEQRVVSVVLVRSPRQTVPATVDVDWGTTMVIHMSDPGETPFARRELVADVAANGGKLEVLADGSMLVVPSGDTTKEKATHAARCAVALRRRLGEVAIAICTGQAVVRGISAIGEVTERAARLLSGDAPPGIRIDQATATLLETRFVVEVDARGVWLRGERMAPELKGLLGRATPCVGRERDLDVLRANFRECVEESVVRAVLVTASPGQGKSRLLHELLKRLRDSGEAFRLLLGSADSLQAGSSFATLGPMLRAVAGVSPADPPEVQRACVRTLGHRLGPNADRVCAFLGELMGVRFDDAELTAVTAARRVPRLMADQTLAAWLDWLEAECAAGPVLIVIEDLQWADPPSVQFLEGALRTVRDKPLLVVGLARPEVTERFPNLWSEHDLTTVRLGPLSRKASERLLDEALGDRIDAETRARLVDRADGNPFYLEELARAVAEGGVDRDVPVTVLGMVHARLDALGEEAKQVLCAASVFGAEFQPAGVQAVLGNTTGEHDVERRLGILAEREVIHEKRGAAERTYRFRHALLRDGAYALLAEADRAARHRLAGDYLERAGETRAAVIAEHFDRGEAPDRAVIWYCKAATQAAEADDLVAMIKYAERGRACGASGEVEGELAFLQADAHCWRREYDAAARAADAAMALLPAGSAMWLRSCAIHLMVALDRGQWDEAQRSGRTMLTAIGSDRVGAPAAVALAIAAHALCVTAPEAPGEEGLETADRLISSAQEASRTSAGLDPLSRAFLALAQAARFSAGGRFDVSLSFNLKAAELFRRAGNLRDAAVAIGNAGSDLIELGAYARADAAIAEGAEIARRMGIFMFENRGLRALLRGEPAAAEKLLRLELEQSERRGNLRARPFIVGWLARALLDQGRHEESIAPSKDAVASDDPVHPANLSAHGTLAFALLALDRHEEALAATDACVAVLSSTQRADGDIYLLLARVHALEANGRRDVAREVLTATRTRIEARATVIEDLSLRESFLAILEHARALKLAREWGC
jgi:hypothetical protein